MNQERLLEVLLSPHMTEKATIKADEENQQVFKVAKNATKLEIKKAVEQLYKVDVLNVNVVNINRKVRRTRHGVGYKKGYKKAYISLAAGQTIDYTSTE